MSMSMSVGRHSQCWSLGTAGAAATARILYPRRGSLCPRGTTSTSPTSPTLSRSTLRYASSTDAPPRRSSAKERQRAERDQLIQSLKESPGKRDARNFLKHFDTPPPAPAPPQTADAAPGVERAARDAARDAARERAERAHHDEWRLARTGVNLGDLYEPTRAVQASPVFSRKPEPETRTLEGIEPLHLALVKLRQPQLLDDATLAGIALTLSQMARLGLHIAVVVDCDDHVVPEPLELTNAWEDLVREQSARIVAALDEFNEPGSFEVDQALACSDFDTGIPSTVQVRGGVEVTHSHLVFPPIEDGIIPVFPPWAYDAELKKVRVCPDEVLLALTRELSGITTLNSNHSNVDDLDQPVHETVHSTGRPLLDRIIILDPLGGLPSDQRADGAHVFVNLEAEYEHVKRDLERFPTPSEFEKQPTEQPSLGSSNPISRFVEAEIAPLPGPLDQIRGSPRPNRYTMNLEVVERALKLLPPSSSALIITPAEAAISSQVSSEPTPTTGVRTRRSKNPLIHNLLTDKPMISSSLPAPLVHRRDAATSPNPATFLKKGIPVTAIPDPRFTGPWKTPTSSCPSIELENDPRIDFPRLVELIDDSFRRKLDARKYLERIRGRVAGIIIAGNYEGAAICTWEAPPSLTTIPPPDSPLWVPYLDKFAVLTSSQGSGGVADIVWGALTRSCFPEGLVWRSRTNNPVNKWYFERSVGVWNLPGGQWTMFWTTEGVVEEWAQRQRGEKMPENEVLGEQDMTKWDTYISVCSGIAPSWADDKKSD